MPTTEEGARLVKNVKLIGGSADGRSVAVEPGIVAVWIPEGPVNHEYSVRACGDFHFAYTLAAEPDGDAFERGFAGYTERAVAS